MILDIFNIALLIIFLVLIFLIIKKYFSLNKYYKKCEDLMKLQSDHFIKDEYEAGNYNKIYQNMLETHSMINHYIISKEYNEKFLICHVNDKNPLSQPIQINEYDKRSNINRIVIIDDINALIDKPSIKLFKTTQHVNITYHDEKTVSFESLNDEKHHSLKKVLLYFSLALFLLFTPVSYFLLSWLVDNVGEHSLDEYINLPTILMGLGLITITCLGNYLLMMLVIRKKRQNNKVVSHG